MRFGEPLDDERFAALVRPGDGISHRDHRRRLRGGRGRPAARRRAGRRPARRVRAGGRDRARLLRGRARGREGLPALHRPAPARPRGLRGLRPDGHRAQPRALRGRFVRPAAAAQPRPHRLHERRGLGRAGGRPRRRAGRAPGRRARSGQRLHARRHRLLRALRRADRLGDGDPQPARAVAGRAGAARGRAPRRRADHPRRRLRRPVPRRRAARAPVPGVGPPHVPPAGLDRARPRAAGAHAPDRASATA